jgi:hypothetical protein
MVSTPRMSVNINENKPGFNSCCASRRRPFTNPLPKDTARGSVLKFKVRYRHRKLIMLNVGLAAANSPKELTESFEVLCRTASQQTLKVVAGS